MKFLERIKRINSAPAGVKASIAFFLANIISSGISYIVTPVYTRMLSTQEYGQVSVFMTWSSVFGIIAMFCLSSGVFNNGMLDYPDERDQYSFSMLVLSNIITVITMGIVVCLYPLISPILKISFPMIILMIILFIFQPAYNFWVARKRYELKYKSVLIISSVCALVSPLTAIVLMCFFDKGDRLYPRIFGAEIALIIVYFCFFILLGFKNKWRLKTKFWKTAFLFNLPLIPHYLSIFLLNSSDKIMISYLVGDSQTAFYSVAHSVATIATLIWASINGSLIPYTYEKCKCGEFNQINKVTIPLMLLFAIGCVVVIMLAPEVVMIMSTSEYYEAIYVIPPIVGGVFFQVQYFIYANIIYYYKKPLFVMIGSLTAVVLNIVLNYFCIRQWGYIAAGYTTIICYAVQALIDYCAMRFVVKKKVYNMKFIFFLSTTVVSISLLSNFVYDLPIVRYGILLIILALAIIFRKRIANVINFKNKEDNNSSMSI